jgi:hypothetical protein
MALVRLRFLLVLAAAVAVVGFWPVLRGHWDRLTKPSRPPQGAVSSGTEYWCPMCPGVVSEWPGKCPVCSMALVRRKKGEAVPLPDGVLARMQLSPDRVLLAGIHTSSLEYMPLVREVTLAGFVSPPSSQDAPAAKSVGVKAAAFEPELAFLREGQAARVTSDALPGKPWTGRVSKVALGVNPQTHTVEVSLEIDASPAELRPGSLVLARIEAPAVKQDWCRRAFGEEWSSQSSAEVAVRCLLRPVVLPDGAGVEALLRAAAAFALLQRGLVPAVPESAVVDHGALKVVYVESMPGMFDGVAVAVGPRCGDWFPVLSGLRAGQRVATAGAFLLDAEARLNPAVAAGYFGASRGSTPAPTVPPSTGDHELIARQKVCPVTGADLDSMGGAVRVEVNGRVIFICCEGCEEALRKNPEKYLSRLARPSP